MRRRSGQPFLCRWSALWKLAILIFVGGKGRYVAAQARPAATGPGTYVAVGGGVSVFQADYGRRYLGGGVIFVDAQPTWQLGVEGEARYLRFNSDEDVTETNYLIGPRYVLRPHRLKPYVKFLVGTSKMTFPFRYEGGRFLTYVPGGGLEYSLDRDITLRIVDFEYQVWPHFATYGQLSPYGVTTGISVRFHAPYLGVPGPLKR